MSSTIDRRMFLKQAAATSLILGFPMLAAGEDRAQVVAPGESVQQQAEVIMQPVLNRTPGEIKRVAPDEVVRTALKRMGEEKKPGLVFLYATDPKSVDALAAVLTSMVAANSSAVHQVFAESVLACLPEQEGERFAGRKKGCNVLLIDTEGKAVDGANIELKPDGLPGGLLALLHGASGARLRERAASQRTELGAETCRKIDRAVGELSDADFRVRSAAADRLVQCSRGATAVLAHAAAAAEDAETSGQLQGVFARLSGAGNVQQRSPVGTVWVQEQVDPCPGCGMAVAPTRSRAFLQLICKLPDNPAGAKVLP